MKTLILENNKNLFSDKNNMSEKITLIEGNNFVSEDNEVAEIMNDFFTNDVSNLNNQGYTELDIKEEDHILNIIN